MLATDLVAKRKGNYGFTLLETLIALVIVAVGLLGLAGLQGVAMQAEFESYQRAQAIILMNDMVDRINSNRDSAGCYAITTNAASGTPYLGTQEGGGYLASTSCAAGFKDADGKSLAESDLAAWDAQLKGAGEKKSGNNVGVMLGARGCVSFDAASSQYTVAVVWQGSSNTFAQANLCATGLYGNERARRVVTTTLRIGNLTAS